MGADESSSAGDQNFVIPREAFCLGIVLLAYIHLYVVIRRKRSDVLSEIDETGVYAWTAERRFARIVWILVRASRELFMNSLLLLPLSPSRTPRQIADRAMTLNEVPTPEANKIPRQFGEHSRRAVCAGQHC